MVSNMGWKIPPHPDEYSNIINLTNSQMIEKEFKVVELLDKVPIGQAISIMERAKSRLLDCHMVDAKKACLPKERLGSK